MTSEVETCHTDVPQTKTKQRLCCRIENWKLSSEGVIICKQRFNLPICSISELLESVTITTAATLHWAALVTGTLETVSCWLAGISVKPGDWRLSSQLPASPSTLDLAEPSLHRHINGSIGSREERNPVVLASL